MNIMTSLDSFVLLPTPRTVVARPGMNQIVNGSRIVCQGDPVALFPVARRLQRALWDTQRVAWSLGAGGAETDHRSGATITLAPQDHIPVQGYRLQVTATHIHLTASDAAGAFYGVMTLTQMLRQSEGSLPAGEIEDHPDFASRGVMLDISRNKVPTIETLFELVDMLSGWKVNHLELYTEHTFAYRNHPEAWAQASPITGEDILRLDAYCRERFVELVPNQNSFGHLHRWLELPRYNHLAECPDGFELRWGDSSRQMPPFSLNPTDPRSLDFLDELYSEVLPHFTSRKFNIGCDETWDLGKGRSAQAVEEKGEGQVYLEFLTKVHELVRKRGLTTHFWGDIVGQHPELVPELPKDAVVLEWGYEADHPFGEHGARLAGSGVPFYVCPGTSSWNSIAGRTDNCLGNLRNAASEGLKHGAQGLLNTDWGDNGHLQYLPVSYLGFAGGAALSWCYEASRDSDFVSALDLHAFRDEARVMGRLAYDLGNASRHTGHEAVNAGTLFHLLIQSPDRALPEEVTPDNLRAAGEYVRSVIEPLDEARMDREDASLIRAEFANAGRMLLHACDRGTAVLEGTIDAPRTREALAAEMRTILGEHRRVWTARNRVGGLQDSARVLEERLREYAGS